MQPANRSITLFLALEPDESLTSVVRAYKRQVRDLAGDQLLVNHPPHLTLYLACFPSPSQVVEAAAGVAAELTAPEIDVAGWHVFPVDPTTGNKTLVLDVARSGFEELCRVQRKVIDALAPLRDPQQSVRRFRRPAGTFQREHHQNLERFGYPFVGQVWRPHLTVASIAPESWTRVKRSLMVSTPDGSARCPKLKVYWLVDNESCVVETFPLPAARKSPSAAKTARA